MKGNSKNGYKEISQESWRWLKRQTEDEGGWRIQEAKGIKEAVTDPLLLLVTKV